MNRLNAHTRKKMQECYIEVRQEDVNRKSIVQQVWHNRTDVLRQIIVPVGGSHAVARVPSLSSVSA